jgi:hypothetical protein
MSEFQHTATYPPQKRRKWPLIAVAAAVLFCLAGVATLYNVTTDTPLVGVAESSSPGGVVGENGAKAAKSAAPKGKQVARTTIGGNDLVHVGEDIPAGTYRVAEAIAGGELCYWMKSRDAEGADIIDNDIAQGGRPQVTLKKGQWFTSQGCPQWAVK